MISRKLVDHTNIGRAIGCLLDLVYAPSAEMKDSVRSTTSLFHTSMAVHPGSNDHLPIHKLQMSVVFTIKETTECKSINEQCRIRI